MTLRPVTRADAQANRKRLIEAARAVFAEHGLGADMKEVAERAGVGMGTIYRNFANKTDLLTDLVGEFIATIRELMDAAEANEDPAEGLATFMRHAFELALDHGALVEGLIATELGAGLVKPAAEKELNHRLAVLIQRGVDTGVFRSNLNARFAADYLGALFPAACIELRNDYTLAELRDGVIDLFLRGIVA